MSETYKVDILIAEQEVQMRIKQLSEELNDFYKESDSLVLIGLLRGSFIFMADLCRGISISHEIDFMTVSSYGDGTTSSREVKILKDIDGTVQGKNVVIVEDIVDTGYTLSKVRELLTHRGAQSVRLCTLLDKPSRREIEVPIDWVGFSIPDKFVIGMGLDYAQKYRHLPYIGHVIFD